MGTYADRRLPYRRRSESLPAEWVPGCWNTGWLRWQVIGRHGKFSVFTSSGPPMSVERPSYLYNGKNLHQKKKSSYWLGALATVFHKEIFQQPASDQGWEIVQLLVFPENNVRRKLLSWCDFGLTSINHINQWRLISEDTRMFVFRWSREQFL